ncbi:type VII secretion integral membrane protein EccD [Micromonospora sp. NPDC049274]|uniref:type VII secretion integral membrane protein EccD n=1 Tax=Micromonospora sp. NPDC049274 TaxID=3154829 RepID=UPI00341C121C
MCRLVVFGPKSQIEVAVPVGVLIADLLPALLSHLDPGLADAGLAHGGWVLQRMGDPPLDEEGTVASQGLRDGDAVHLRPRSDQIPPVAFDDVADGVATGMRGRSAVWRPAMLRWAALGAAGVTLVVALWCLAMPGPPLARAMSASILAVLLLGAAFALTRAAGEWTFGLLTAAGGTAAAALAGLIAPDTGRPAQGLVLASPELLTASVAATVAALLGAMLVGRSGPLFAALVAAASASAVGAGLCMFAGLTATQGAATVAVVVTVLTVTLPSMALRLAGMQADPLPTQPEHLQEDIDPAPSEALLARTTTADGYLTALHTGLGVTVAVSLTILATESGWVARSLVLLVALVRLLIMRPMINAWHRLALAAPAVLGLAVATLSAATHTEAMRRLIIATLLAPLVVTALVLGTRRLSDRRPMPVWGRIGDITQTIATIAMLPVLLALLGVYAVFRAIGG